MLRRGQGGPFIPAHEGCATHNVSEHDGGEFAHKASRKIG